MAPLIDWDNPDWGKPGHNTHTASSGNYGHPGTEADQ